MNLQNRGIRARRFSNLLTPVLVGALVLASGCSGGAASPDNPNALLAGEKEQGFVPLFNGRSLDGWVIDRSDVQSFEVRKGLLYCTGKGNYETILRTTKMYENFELRLEYQTPGWTESGVIIHVPPVGRAIRMGTKIQIYHQVGDKEEPTVAGSIFGVLAPKKDLARGRNEWNDLRILMDWPRLVVDLNGERIHDLNVEEFEELKYRERNGYIALQDIKSDLYFHRIRIRELPSKEKWEIMFNGRDFTGWHIMGRSKWDVRDGVIHAERSTGYLISDKKYQDFEFKATIRESLNANGGIFLRWRREDAEKDRGYEAQIRNCPDASHPSGSLYEYERARDDEIIRGSEWYVMHIIAKGPHIVIRVDGKTMAEIHNAKKIWPGSIALQMHSSDSWVEWKDIKIKDLSPSASATTGGR